MSKSKLSYKYSRSVTFKDTDMAGIVHFTQLITYVEEAEHAALLSIGVKPMSSAGGFPKVHVDCDYRSPARFRDKLEVRIGIKAITESSVQWGFEMVTGSGIEKKICEGSLVTAFVNQQGNSEVIKDETRTALEDLLVK